MLQDQSAQTRAPRLLIEDRPSETLCTRPIRSLYRGFRGISALGQSKLLGYARGSSDAGSPPGRGTVGAARMCYLCKRAWGGDDRLPVYDALDWHAKAEDLADRYHCLQAA